MRIDLNPYVRRASPLEQTIMEIREISSLYVCLTSDGNEFTVQWDSKSLELFCPSRSVSEMLQSWQDGLIREYQLLVNSVNSGIHPYHTKREQVLHPITNLWTGKWLENQPLNMTKSTSKVFERRIEELKLITGPLTFVEITINPTRI